MISPPQVQEIFKVISQGPVPSGWQVVNCRADGSVRRFFRIWLPQEFAAGLNLPGNILFAVLPHGDGQREQCEARASFFIGRHLHGRDIPVPQALGYDPVSGLVLFEDLGDTLLHGLVVRNGVESVMDRYREAVRLLVRFQVEGRIGFDHKWCCDTGRYDRRTMLERESGYFLESFWKGWLGQDPRQEGLADEFEALADRASEEPADFLMHRDFQCRNLMVYGGRLRIIDFQGARFGPLAYDLAALLLDPYAGLTADQQQELMDCYLEAARKHIFLDPSRFVAGYYYMALQRTLQILGAFGFLTTVRNKPFFRDYISPALYTLNELTHRPAGRRFPVLRSMSSFALDRVKSENQPGNGLPSI